MRVWLITGCSSGLGESIAETVLQRGDAAAVTSRDISRVMHFEQDYPDRVLTAALDLADPDSLRNAVDATLQRFGTIDVLVNNAGHGYRATIEESEPEAVHHLFEVNFFSPMELIRLVLPLMRKKKQGLICNVTSIGAVRGALGNGYYSAAKGALELATEALQKEMEPFGIRAMLVEPGGMRTGFYGERMGGTEHLLSAYDAIADQYRKERIVDHQDQTSDPKRCARILVDILLSDNPPFRLLLGSDAVSAAEKTLKDRLAELEAYRNVSVQSDAVWKDKR